MKLVKCESKDIPQRRTGNFGKYNKIVNEFIEQSMKCCEIKIHLQENPKSVRVGLSRVVRKRGYNIKIMVREGKIYMADNNYYTTRED